MMMRRRRPLLRGAAMAAGGAAVYHAGKSKGAAQTDQAYHEADQDAQLQQMQQQQAAVQAAPPAAPLPAAPAAPAITDDSMAELERLGKLHSSGVLTDEEFAAAKAKVLGL